MTVSQSRPLKVVKKPADANPSSSTANSSADMPIDHDSDGYIFEGTPWAQQQTKAHVGKAKSKKTKKAKSKTKSKEQVAEEKQAAKVAASKLAERMRLQREKVARGAVPKGYRRPTQDEIKKLGLPVEWKNLVISKNPNPTDFPRAMGVDDNGHIKEISNGNVRDRGLPVTIKSKKTVQASAGLDDLVAVVSSAGLIYHVGRIAEQKLELLDLESGQYLPAMLADCSLIRVDQHWHDELLADLAELGPNGAVLLAAADTTSQIVLPDGTKQFAVVLVDDPAAVTDLIAIAPGPKVYTWTKGSWVENGELLDKLRSITPPKLVTLDDEQAKSVADQITENESVTAAALVFQREAVLAAFNDALILTAGLGHSPRGAENLREYWVHGKGALKIKWGAPGDWQRCVNQLTKYLGVRAKGYCALRHKEATGMWTAQHAKVASARDGDGDGLINDATSPTPVPPKAKLQLGNEVPRATLDSSTPGAETMNSYGYKYAEDVFNGSTRMRAAEERHGKFDPEFQGEFDVPLENIRYGTQSHVMGDHVRALADLSDSGEQLDPAWGQRLPDGSVFLVEGHHRAAAAALRTKPSLRMKVYGHWPNLEPLTAAGPRIVRTPQGAEWYNQPIGSVIVKKSYLHGPSKSIGLLKKGDVISSNQDPKRKIGVQKIVPSGDGVTVQGVDVDTAEDVKETFLRDAEVKTWKEEAEGVKARLDDTSASGHEDDQLAGDESPDLPDVSDEEKQDDLSAILQKFKKTGDDDQRDLAQRALDAVQEAHSRNDEGKNQPHLDAVTKKFEKGKDDKRSMEERGVDAVSEAFKKSKPPTSDTKPQSDAPFTPGEYASVIQAAGPEDIKIFNQMAGDYQRWLKNKGIADVKTLEADRDAALDAFKSDPSPRNAMAATIAALKHAVASEKEPSYPTQVEKLGMPIVDKAIADAKGLDSEVTGLMDELAKKFNAPLDGRDFRLKGEGSMRRKVLDELNMRDPDGWGDPVKISDGLRYTMVTDTEGYATNVAAILKELEAKGYKPRVKNYWKGGNKYDPANPFRGINVALTYPDPDGKHPDYEIELQFHTPESISTKMGGGAHEAYEVFRASDEVQSAEAKEAATSVSQAGAAWMDTVQPPNTDTLNP